MLNLYKQYYGEISKQELDTEQLQIALPYYMPSLNKIYFRQKQNDVKKLQKWIDEYAKKRIFNLSIKLDGVSILLYFKKNSLSLYTRGNGKKGRDITYLLKYLNIKKELVQYINNTILPQQKEIALRGELVLRKDIFEQKYKEQFASTRQLSTQINKKYINSIEDIKILNDLDIVVYQIYQKQNNDTSELQKQLSKFIQFVHQKDYKIKDEKVENIIYDLKQFWEDYTHNLKGYSIDGIVIKQYDYDGIQSKEYKNPENQIAIKFDDEEKKTEVIMVQWDESRRDRLSPVIIIKPVELDGTIVKRVTGFNAKYILDNKIGPGTIVTVVKQGQVIPQIKEIIQSTEAQMPDQEYKWDKNKVDIYTPQETIESKAKKIYFVFEQCQIKGMGKQTVLQIIKEVEINDVFEFLNLQEEKLQGLQGFKQKKIDNTMDQIQKLKDFPYQSSDNVLIFVSSLSLQSGIGYKILKSILDQLSYSLMQLLTKQDIILNNIEGLQDIRIEQVKQFINKLNDMRSNYQYLEEIIKRHKIEQQQVQKQEQGIPNNKLIDGFTFLLTGSRDNTIKETILKNNGTMVDTYSKKAVDIIIVMGSSLQGSSKIDKGIKDKKKLYIVLMKDDEEKKINKQIKEYENKIILQYEEFIHQ